MKTLSLLAALSVATLVAACSSGEASSPGGTAPAGTTTDPTEPPPSGNEPTQPTDPGTKPPPETKVSATPPLRSGVDKDIVAELTKGGIDVATLPDTLEAAIGTRAKREAVMKAFTMALGVGCEGCHAASGGRVDYGADTPKKNVAKKMWTNLVRGLKQKDNSALFCDSCHQGKMTFLDRKDDEALSGWMQANFVDKMVRKDGAKHDCSTCHGKPFDGNFIDSWKN